MCWHCTTICVVGCCHVVDHAPLKLVQRGACCGSSWDPSGLWCKQSLVELTRVNIIVKWAWCPRMVLCRRLQLTSA